jgi:hypothetical protein
MTTTYSESGWAGTRLLPAFEAARELEVYDIRAAPYDVQLCATALAGLVNRRQPRVYLLSNGDDEVLLRGLLAHIPARFHVLPPESAILEILGRYANDVQGKIIYDPSLLDSVNVATTLAGLRDAVVVSPQLAETLDQLPVLVDLRIYAWKNRLQAYRWAERNLLKEASPRLVAGLNPQIAGSLRSLLVAARAFVYWLDPRFRFPDPFNGWSMERCLIRRILATYAPGTPHLGWVVDERRGVTLASRAALPVVPSDHFSNMEVWIASRNPTPDTHKGYPYMSEGLSTPPRIDTQSAKVYVSFTMSDGDNLQYCQHRMYHLWQDAARGSVPLGWTISPLLPEAAPALAEYYRRTASVSDELIAGPSGAGYILPSKWPGAQLDSFLRLTGTRMQRMGLSLIETLDAPLTRFFPHRAWQNSYAQALAPYGVRGMLVGDAYKKTGWWMNNGMPLVQNLGLVNSVEKALQLIHDNTPAAINQPQFLSLYAVVWNLTPSDIKRVVASLDDRYVVVTPGTMLSMIAETSK